MKTTSTTKAVLLAIACSISASLCAQSPPPALTPAMAAQVENAANANDVAALTTLLQNNPTLAATIAQTLVTKARALARINPAAAAQLASTLASIASASALQRALPQVAASLAIASAEIVALPAVLLAAPALAKQVATRAITAASTPAIRLAVPSAATQVQTFADIVNTNPSPPTNVVTNQNNTTDENEIVVPTDNLIVSPSR